MSECGVQAESIVIAASRPDVDVVTSMGRLRWLRMARATSSTRSSRGRPSEGCAGIREDADAGPQDQQADANEKSGDPVSA